MASQATFSVTDPRDADAALTARFTIHDAGSDPHGYGEHFDPGSGPEIEVTRATDVSGADVLPLLSDDQAQAVEDEIVESFDFRDWLRSEREDFEASREDW